jgi:hypothetical protein
MRPVFTWQKKPDRHAPIQNLYTERLHAFIERGHLLEVKTPADAQRQLGKPITRTIKKIKNKHEKSMEEWRTYTYAGLILVFYHAVNHNRYFLFNIEITSSRQPVMYDLQVGKTKEAIIDILGELGRGVDTSLEYFDFDEDYLPGLVRFYFKKLFISRIVWIYPLD